VSTDDSDHSGDKLLQLLRDNQIDLTVVEGLRLVIAFKKIKAQSDRRILLELAERLAR
jgi:molybdopterin-guanine dinucleotide biosynthesis protein